MLYYEKCGKGPVVVLLHGLPCNHTIWKDLSDVLSGEFCFILPDFPGAGKSYKTNDGFSLSLVAKELAVIFEEEQIHKAVLAGHSMGGYAVMAFARLFPDKVKGISLIHSYTAADSEEKKTLRKKSIKLIQKGASEKEGFVRALVRNLFAETFPKRHPDIFEKAVQMGQEISAETLVHYYKALMIRDNNTSLLTKHRWPMQWILGTEDQAANPQLVLPFAHLAEVNDVCIYPHCGHMGMFEMPERLKQDLARFWRYVYSR